MQDASTTFDLAADNYNQQLQQGLTLSGESADFFVQGRLSYLAELLRARAAEVKTVLDFGCGVGNAAPALRSLLGASHVAGLDCSHASIQCARQRFPESCYQWSADSNSIPDTSFDLVHTSGVFHHIPLAERDDALSDIYGWLRPGGRFAFFENNPWNPGTRLVMSRIPFDRDAICLSMLESRRRLRQAGFVLEAVRSMFFFPKALGFLRWMERPLGYSPLGAQYLILCRKPMKSLDE